MIAYCQFPIADLLEIARWGDWSSQLAVGNWHLAIGNWKSEISET